MAAKKKTAQQTNTDDLAGEVQRLEAVLEELRTAKARAKEALRSLSFEPGPVNPGGLEALLEGYRAYRTEAGKLEREINYLEDLEVFIMDRIAKIQESRAKQAALDHLKELLEVERAILREIEESEALQPLERADLLSRLAEVRRAINKAGKEVKRHG